MGFDKLSEKMKAVLKKAGFSAPTEIQSLGIPEILQGKDVLVIGSTGSGKTEAVMLPVMDMISEGRMKPISAIYITPLKALNRDLLDRLSWWASSLEIDISVRHGDTSSQERKQQMEFPPHILITTPETLMGSITSKKFRSLISNLKFLIIDEIHEIVQSKRGASLSLLIERMRKIAGDFQRIGISATVGSERKVAKFLSENAKIVKSASKKRMTITVEKPENAAEDIADNLGTYDEAAAKAVRILELMKSARTSMVFTNTRQTAEILGSRIKSIEPDFPVLVHHGSLSKAIRTEAEEKLKNGEIRSIIATSSLELGIDVGSVDLVIQYLSPRQVSKFLQRLGRSGHRFDRVSRAVIISDGEDLFESYAIARLSRKGVLEKIRMHEMALDILAIHIVGMTIEYYEIQASEAYETIKGSYLYRNLKWEQFLEVVEFLSQHHLLFFDGEVMRRSRRGMEYYFSNLSPIPDSRTFRIINISTREYVGSLDEKFVADYGEIGSSFIVGGRAWKIVNIEGDRIYVTESPDIRTAVPSWEGELIPVSREVAEEVSLIREKMDFDDSILNKTAISEMRKILKKQEIMPTTSNILVERYEDYVIIHSVLGSRANETLGRYISEIIIQETGESVEMKSDAYRIVIRTDKSIDKISSIIKDIRNVRKVVESSLRNSTLLKWRFIHNAIRFGIIDRKADYRKVSLNKIISIYRHSPVYEETLREIETDKLDIESVNEVARNIRKGNIRVVQNTGKTSVLGMFAVSERFGEMVRPLVPEGEILRMYKRRLLNTRIILYCMNCKDFSIHTSVRDAPEEPECPKCGSRFIAMSGNREKYRQVWKKMAAGKKLEKGEEKIAKTFQRTADMIIAYGKKAILALAARGVGPEFAGRILRRLHPTEEELLKDLLEAEKEFIKNKQYWE